MGPGGAPHVVIPNLMHASFLEDKRRLGSVVVATFITERELLHSGRPIIARPSLIKSGSKAVVCLPLPGTVGSPPVSPIYGQFNAFTVSACVERGVLTPRHVYAYISPKTPSDLRVHAGRDFDMISVGGII